MSNISIDIHLLKFGFLFGVAIAFTPMMKAPEGKIAVGTC